uniref:SH3 domain-containing protein n=1 Tax=Parastrongyloides trichosuri TaxID=131310 RepID=A0A0N4ZCE4_PARTI
MLSLISLILASGSILKGETEEWTAATYPNPSINATLCNTWQNATLCDPDHILSEHWRSVIIENIEKQKSSKFFYYFYIFYLRCQEILSLDKIYTDSTPKECYTNSTVEIYVILARKIQTASNESTTNDDMVNFGDEIVSKYGLNNKKCNNYVMLLGVEAAKIAYVRAGTSLKLPKNFFHTVFNRTTNLFREKNYMEGLNKIIDEMGDEMVNLFNEIKQTTEIYNESTEMVSSTELPNGSFSDIPIIENHAINLPRSLKYNMPSRKSIDNEKEISSYNGINTYEENVMNAFFIILIILFFILFISLMVLLFSQYYKKRHDSALTGVITPQTKKTISQPIINEVNFKDRHGDIEPDPEFLDMLKRRESSRMSNATMKNDMIEQTNITSIADNTTINNVEYNNILSNDNTIIHENDVKIDDKIMKIDNIEPDKVKKEQRMSNTNLGIIEEVDETISTLENVQNNAENVENLYGYCENGNDELIFVKKDNNVIVKNSENNENDSSVCYNTQTSAKVLTKEMNNDDDVVNGISVNEEIIICEKYNEINVEEDYEISYESSSYNQNNILEKSHSITIKDNNNNSENEASNIKTVNAINLIPENDNSIIDNTQPTERIN